MKTARKTARRGPDAQGNRRKAARKPSKKPLPKKQAPAALPEPPPFGDAFVALDSKGRYFDGAGWTTDLALAHRFVGEPDPFAEAAGFCAKQRARRVRCWPLYLPRSLARTSAERKSSPSRSRGTQPCGGLPTIATA